MPLIYKSKKEPDYSTTYTPFVVSKPIWSECGMPGYQKQSAEVLQNIINQFNQPEFIPLMSELFSKMLVICAKNNFETKKPKKMTGNQKRTFFSPEHKMAYSSHEKICQAWRKEGRPTDINPKEAGGGGGEKFPPPTVFRLFKPNFVIRIWPVNISKFKYVHPGHFATILRSPGCPGKF